MWAKIEKLDKKQMQATREMFIVRGYQVEGVSVMPYTTDAYTVWMQEDGSFARWPHKFPPTHFIFLPKDYE